MPYRKKYKRKKYKKKQWNKRSGSGLSPTYPMSRTFKFKTRYFEEVELESGPGGLPGTQVFRLTSLYDPNYTGTGHQPIGYDQIMPMYDHYTVIGARVRVTCWNRAGIGQRIILAIKDEANATIDPVPEIENGNCRWACLGPNLTGSSTKTLTINFSANKFFGRKVLQGDKYAGSIHASPLDNAFLHLSCSPLLGQAVSGVRCSVLIEYIAILTEPRTLSLS